MPPWDDPAVRAAYEAAADRPQVQALIREAIRGGLIRVAPGPGGGIRIAPAGARAAAEAPPAGSELAAAG
jgi:hypothetical protein